MSETLVERMAPAICIEAVSKDTDIDANYFAERNWEMWLPLALAALRAIREPTEAMISAGYKALMEWDARTGDDQGIAEVWQAMIDAAIAEAGGQEPQA